MGTSVYKVIPPEEAGVEPKSRGKMKAVLLTFATVKQGVYRGQQQSPLQMRAHN